MSDRPVKGTVVLEAKPMSPEMLVMALYLIIRLAIIAGVVYFAIIEIRRERRRK